MPGSGAAHAIERFSHHGPRRWRGLSLSDEAVRRWSSLSLACKLSVAGGAGVGAAFLVGYVTSRNPAADPTPLAVPLRVLLIVLLVAAGIYGCTNPSQARIGALLIGLGFYSALWLLDGSSSRLLFSVGVGGRCDIQP